MEIWILWRDPLVPWQGSGVCHPPGTSLSERLLSLSVSEQSPVCTLSLYMTHLSIAKCMQTVLDLVVSAVWTHTITSYIIDLAQLVYKQRWHQATPRVSVGPSISSSRMSCPSMLNHVVISSSTLMYHEPGQALMPASIAGQIPLLGDIPRPNQCSHVLRQRSHQASRGRRGPQLPTRQQP